MIGNYYVLIHAGLALKCLQPGSYERVSQRHGDETASAQTSYRETRWTALKGEPGKALR